MPEDDLELKKEMCYEHHENLIDLIREDFRILYKLETEYLDYGGSLSDFKKLSPKRKKEIAKLIYGGN